MSATPAADARTASTPSAPASVPAPHRPIPTGPAPADVPQWMASAPSAPASAPAPRVVPALGLTDALGAHNVRHAIDDLLASGRYERVYLGSYFCGRYFAQQPLGVFTQVLAACENAGLPVTLVVPIPSERELDGVLGRVEALLAGYGRVIDELTCNGLGMLAWCTEHGGGRRLNADRLLSRDVREPGFVRLVGRPSLLTRNRAQAFPGCRVDGYEFDPVHEALDLSGAPADATCALHVDWCYASTGKICEFASVGAPPERKFRPGAPCAFSCLHYTMEHRARDEAPVYFKHGRTVYYRQPDARCVGVSSYRLVRPVLLTEGCERP